MNMEIFLEDMVLFINQVRENPNSSRIKEIGRRIARQYFAMKQQGIDYMSYFEQEFADDAELFILLLSVLFFLFHEKEVLDKVEEVVQWDTLPYDTAIGIVKQTGMSRFNDKKLQTTYESQRLLQKHMTARLKRELGGSLSYIPYREREHNRILLSTDTLLSDKHAPTGIVLRIAKGLQEFGFDVRILVNIERMDREAVENCWLYPYYPHYMSKWDGEFERSWENCTLRGYQHIIDTVHFEQVRTTLEWVANWRPECVWHIGGVSSFAELFGEITTLAVMPCTAHLAVSDAPVLVGYFQESVYHPAALEYVAKQGQQRIRIRFGGNRTAVGRGFTKKDFGIKESAFAIAIVGNRLDTEIDSEFIKVMQEIVKREPLVCFVLIGQTKRRWDMGCLEGHIKCLGYQKDLVDVLEVTDLFLNPPRQGGGGGSVCALAAGVPILTLPEGDVAAGLEMEDFVCEHLQDIPDWVSKYIHDERYYHQQVQICEDIQKKFLSMYQTEKDEFKKVLVQIREWLREKTII